MGENTVEKFSSNLQLQAMFKALKSEAWHI